MTCIVGIFALLISIGESMQFLETFSFYTNLNLNFYFFLKKKKYFSFLFKLKQIKRQFFESTHACIQFFFKYKIGYQLIQRIKKLTFPSVSNIVPLNFFFSKPLEGLVVYFDYMNCMRFSSLPFAYILPFIVKKNSRIIYVRENLKILYIQQFSNETMMVSSSGSILVSLK